VRVRVRDYAAPTAVVPGQVMDSGRGWRVHPRQVSADGAVLRDRGDHRGCGCAAVCHVCNSRGEPVMAEKNAVKVAAGKQGGRPATVTATEAWNMRVNAEWLARVKVKAKDWNVSVSELIRVLVEHGLEGDMEVLFPPTKPEMSVREKIRRGGRQ
jgi:hypothetical protein